MNLSGDRRASGSPHRSRLDENAAADEYNDDGLMNIGLVIDFVLRDDPPPPENLELDSDNPKKPRFRRKNGDFIPL